MATRLLRPGDRIGDWKIESPLGEGGMGAVYLARNAMSDRIKAAVKVHKPHNLDDERDRFLREVEALYALRHPAVVRVTGWGEDEERGLLFLAMELVEGEELSRRLHRGAALSEDMAIKAFAMLADGLRHCHERGIAHRDVKPANVMLTHSGQARLLDFGIAHSQGRTRLTSAGVAAGTLGYLPPETFSDEPLDPYLADVYALGLLLHESLVGQIVFDEQTDLSGNQQTAKLIAKKLRSKRLDPGKGFSRTLRDLIAEATEPDPSRRLSTMREFAVRLGAKPTETHVHSRQAAPTNRGPDPSARSTSRVLRTGGVVVAAGSMGLLAISLGVGALGIGGGAVWWVTAGTPQSVAAPEDAPDATADAGDDKAVDTAVPPEPAAGSDKPAPKPMSQGSSPPASRPPAQAKPKPKPKPAPKPTGVTYPVTFASVPMGQTVLVDGHEIGTTPIANHPLASGRHTVRMEGTAGNTEHTITVGRRDPKRYVWKGGSDWEAFH